MHKTKATSRPGPNTGWGGPTVAVTWDIITRDTVHLPIGKGGDTVGRHIDKLLASAWENGDRVGVVTVDCTDMHPKGDYID